MKFNSLTLIALAVFLTACSSENNPSTEELLSGQWKLNAQYVLLDAHEDAREQVTLDECVRDNIYIFSLAGTYTIDPGTIKCSDTEPGTPYTTPWNGLNEAKNLSTMGLERLESISPVMLTTRTDYSGRFPEVKEYVPVE